MMGLFSFSNKPPGQDQFARMVLDVVRQAGEKGKIINDRGAISPPHPERLATWL